MGRRFYRSHLALLLEISFIGLLLSVAQASSISLGTLQIQCNPMEILEKTLFPISYSSHSYFIIEAEAAVRLPSNLILSVSIEDHTFLLLPSPFIQENRAYLIIEQADLPLKLSQKPLEIQCTNLSEDNLEINLNIRGINSLNSINHPQCLFNCSKDLGKGECLMTDVCQCSPGYFGYDCGVQGENMLDYFSIDKEALIQFSGIKYFFLEKSSIDFYTQFLEINTLVIQNLTLSVYHGSLSLPQIFLYQDLTSSSEFQVQTISFKESSSTEFLFVVIQNLANSSETSFVELFFSLKPIDNQKTGFFSGKTTYDILVICLFCVFFQALLVILIITRKFLRNCLFYNEKAAIYKNQQIKLKIDKEMPSQSYEQLILRFPNLSQIQECNICLEDFEPSENVMLTHCFHVFHSQCLKIWMMSRSSLLCPLCRKTCQESQKDTSSAYKMQMRYQKSDLIMSKQLSF